MFDALKFYQRINSERLSFSTALLMKKFQPNEGRYLLTYGFFLFIFPGVQGGTTHLGRSEEATWNSGREAWIKFLTHKLSAFPTNVRNHSIFIYIYISHGLQPTRLLRPWDFPGKSTGVGCHCLLPYIWTNFSGRFLRAPLKKKKLPCHMACRIFVPLSSDRTWAPCIGRAEP